MNLFVCNIDGNGQVGGLLVVLQFMLVVDIKFGMWLSFMFVVVLEDGCCLYEYFVVCVCVQYFIVVIGEFGVDMKVLFVNDGLVMFWLQVVL